MVKTIVLTISAVCVVCFSGCSNKTSSTESDRKIRVVATIFPLMDWTSHVGGDHVLVTTLLPGGTSPHTFEPTTRQIRDAADARLFLKVGLGMDDWASKIAETGTESKVVSLGDWILEKNLLPDVEHMVEESSEIGVEHEGHSHEHSHDGPRNPHFWLDPSLAQQCVSKIAEELGTIAPDQAAQFIQRAEEYNRQLAMLDTEVSRSLEQLSSRDLVTFHNAFPYFAKRYNLNVAGVIEEYPGKTPSDSYLKGVTDALRKRNIRTIFSEPQLSPKAAEIIADEVHGKVTMIDPYGSSTEASRDSYEKLIRFNADQISKALK